MSGIQLKPVSPMTTPLMTITDICNDQRLTIFSQTSDNSLVKPHSVPHNKMTGTHVVLIDNYDSFTW